MSTEELWLVPSAADGCRRRIWPGIPSPPEELVQENSVWFFELTGASDPYDLELTIEGIPLLRDMPRPHTVRWRWEIGFLAGSASIQLSRKGRTVASIDLVVDPDQDKLTRADFKCMVKDILQDTLAIFQLSGFKQGLGRGNASEKLPLAQLEYLRSQLPVLEKAVADINEQPVRSLVREVRRVPFRKAVRGGQFDLAKSLRGRLKTLAPEQIAKLPGLAKLTSRTGGRIPVDVVRAFRTPSTNVREHQDILGGLELLRAYIASSQDLIAAAFGNAPESVLNLWKTRTATMLRRIARLAELPVFRGIVAGPGTLRPSRVFRRVPAYARFYRVYKDFRLGISNVVGDFLDLPLARTFDLYETWAYLRLAHAAALELAATGFTAKDLISTKPGSSQITLDLKAKPIGDGKSFTMHYQRRFGELWKQKEGAGSYSREMIPDIAIELISVAAGSQAKRLLVLDAKYRVGKSLDDALTSTHTYRDAIVQPKGSDWGSRGDLESAITAALILVPQGPAAGALDSDWKNAPMNWRYFHPEYIKTFGFGAVEFRPGISLGAAREVLRMALSL